MTDTSCDVIVVGAGPAGLAAAQAAAAHGLRVLLLDEQASAGGQIWRNAARRANGPLGAGYRGAREALQGAAADGIEHAAMATVLDVAIEGDGTRVTWLSAKPGARGIREDAAQALVVATGAMERPLLFAGAELPGVMGVGAVQAVLKQSGLVPEGVVLAGQGPLLLLTLSQILDRGGRVEAVLDLAPKGAFARAASGALAAFASDPKLMAQGVSLVGRARRSGVPWYHGVHALRAEGQGAVEAVRFEADGQTRRLPCNLLAVHDGVIPNTQLTRLMHLAHDWKPGQQAFAPRRTAEGRTSAPSVWVAGDGAGIAGVEVAGLRGALAGLDVARACGALSAAQFQRRAAPLARRIAARAPARAFLERLFAPLPVAALAGPPEETLVCRCEAVTLAQVRGAIAEGASGPNRVKTFTRCGMGACQGRMCGNPLSRIVAAETKAPPQALRIRAPLKPTLISDYLGLEAPPEGGS